MAISNSERELNRALRLRHAGSEADGLTVKFLKTCDHGVEGETAVVANATAALLLAEGAAESAE